MGNRPTRREVGGRAGPREEAFDKWQTHRARSNKHCGKRPGSTWLLAAKVGVRGSEIVAKGKTLMTLMVYNDRMFLAAPFLDASPWLPGGVANRLLQFRPGSCGVLRAGHRHPWCRVPGASATPAWRRNRRSLCGQFNLCVVVDHPPCKVAVRTDLRAALGGHSKGRRGNVSRFRHVTVLALNLGAAAWPLHLNS